MKRDSQYVIKKLTQNIIAYTYTTSRFTLLLK